MGEVLFYKASTSLSSGKDSKGPCDSKRGILSIDLGVFSADLSSPLVSVSVFNVSLGMDSAFLFLVKLLLDLLDKLA